MSRYYIGRQARRYNTRLRTFTERTLSEALTMVDVAALRNVPARLGRPPRVLDVACGTGIFLKQLLGLLPNIQAYGIDASADMLAQAHAALEGQPAVQLAQVAVGIGTIAHLPYAPGMFDLITCTNTLHAIPDPVSTLVAVRQLLASGGQLVLEDFARRAPPFPWKAFAWLVRRVVGSQVHIYSLAEAQAVCRQAGLQLVCEKAFSIDWLLHGWALRAQGAFD